MMNLKFYTCFYTILWTAVHSPPCCVMLSVFTLLLSISPRAYACTLLYEGCVFNFYMFCVSIRRCAFTSHTHTQASKQPTSLCKVLLRKGPFSKMRWCIHLASQDIFSPPEKACSRILSLSRSLFHSHSVCVSIMIYRSKAIILRCWFTHHWLLLLI